jgi:Flp pilus assembly protein TadG
VMILMMVGSYEFTQALVIQGKLSQLARTMSDMVTREEKVSKTMLEGMAAASKWVMFPHSVDASVIDIKVESVFQESATVYKTDWKFDADATSVQTADVVTTAIPDTSAVRTEATYRYTPLLGEPLKKWFDIEKFTLSSSVYMAPRPPIARVLYQ